MVILDARNTGKATILAARLIEPLSGVIRQVLVFRAFFRVIAVRYRRAKVEHVHSRSGAATRLSSVCVRDAEQKEGGINVNETIQRVDKRRLLSLLAPRIQRALHRGGIWQDSDIAGLTDKDLSRLAYIGPAALQEIRKYFPEPR